MYFYIYDSFLSDKKYESTLARVEARLLELGINGKIEKLTILKNLKEMVQDALKKGAKTLVVVGDDTTLSKVISYVAPHKKATLGYIPVGPEKKIAELLGIPSGEAACDVLSKRIVHKFDLGKVNKKYFLFNLDIAKKKNVKIECDGNYTIEAITPDSSLKICNLGLLEEETYFNPGDGLLEAVVLDKKSGWNIFKSSFKKDSVFPIKKAKIKCHTECVSLVADGETIIKTPATVSVVPKRLNIIVGRGRKF